MFVNSFFLQALRGTEVLFPRCHHVDKDTSNEEMLKEFIDKLIGDSETYTGTGTIDAADRTEPVESLLPGVVERCAVETTVQVYTHQRDHLLSSLPLLVLLLLSLVTVAPIVVSVVREIFIRGDECVVRVPRDGSYRRGCNREAVAQPMEC